MKTQPVLDQLEMAIRQRRPKGVIHHSDHGSKCTSIGFEGRCRRAGILPSMGSVADCFDNALCESFLSTLECELIDRHRFSTRAEAQRAVFDFIEGWYNLHQLHSSLGYDTPARYEKRYAARIAKGKEESIRPERHRDASEEHLKPALAGMSAMSSATPSAEPGQLQQLVTPHARTLLVDPCLLGIPSKLDAARQVSPADTRSKAEAAHQSRPVNEGTADHACENQSHDEAAHVHLLLHRSRST